MHEKPPTQYWLFKSEPAAYSIDDLKRDTTTRWDGIRNYQVRNLMRDQMRIGDRALFYHSNVKQIGVVGVLDIISDTYPDPLQFDRKSQYYDPTAKITDPRWLCLDVAYVETFPYLISMETLRTDRKLRDLPVARKGNRLSITPVTPTQFARICALGHGV